MNRLPLFALVLLGGCADQAPPADPQRILGDWVVVDFHSPKGTEDRSQLRKQAIITEGTWSQQFQGDTFEDFEYALDPTKTPKEIDLIYTAMNGKRLTIRGIYELAESDQMGDRLRVCLGSPPVQKKDKSEYTESVRPTAFEPKSGSLISYRRKPE